MNISNTPTPYFTYWKRSWICSKTKYICLSPSIANMLDEYTIIRSVDTENTAGTESMAKIISDLSTRQSMANNGVNSLLPFSCTMNFLPRNPSVIGRQLADSPDYPAVLRLGLLVLSNYHLYAVYYQYRPEYVKDPLEGHNQLQAKENENKPKYDSADYSPVEDSVLHFLPYTKGQEYGHEHEQIIYTETELDEISCRELEAALTSFDEPYSNKA